MFPDIGTKNTTTAQTITRSKRRGNKLDTLPTTSLIISLADAPFLKSWHSFVCVIAAFLFKSLALISNTVLVRNRRLHVFPLPSSEWSLSVPSNPSHSTCWPSMAHSKIKKIQRTKGGIRRRYRMRGQWCASADSYCPLKHARFFPK